MDRREATWRTWCSKKGMDTDPMVGKVQEYLLDEWVDVGEGQKWRVSAEKGRGLAPSRGRCASDIRYLRDWKCLAFAAAWHAPIRSDFFAADLKILVLAVTASFPMRSSPLAERHLCMGLFLPLSCFPIGPRTISTILDFPLAFTRTLPTASTNASLPKSPA